MLKLFAYLDEYKMYSADSQIFEGLTEQIVTTATRATQESEDQRGPLGSGRLLAEIATETSGRQERKFLHDYAYTLFEDRLSKDGRVTDIDASSIENIDTSGSDVGLVRVTGRVVFSDVRSVTRTLAQINRLGAALASVSAGAEKQAQLAALKVALSTAKGQKKEELRRQIADTQKPPLDTLDPKYVEDLKYLLDYGFEDHLEIQIRLGTASGERLFSAVLDRKYLREPESLLIKKYARLTEKTFTLFGAVTQSTRVSEVVDDSAAVPEGNGSIKSATSEVVRRLTVLEDQFVGRLPNEVIIDPIAIYRHV